MNNDEGRSRLPFQGHPNFIWGGIVVGVLALGGVSLNLLLNAKATEPEPRLGIEAPQRVAVVALGRLEPLGEVIRLGGPVGERISQLLVSQGDTVAAQEIVAYLESHDEQRAERDLKASQLGEAEDRLQASTRLREAQIEEARRRLQQIEQPKTFEIQAQQASIRELEAELELAEQDLQRFQDLYQDGAIAEQELDRQRTLTRELEEQLNNAQARLSQLQSDQEMDLYYAQAQLASAEAQLALTQVEAAVASAHQDLELAEARLERTLIRAPQAGRVLRVLAHAGEALDSQGILELGDTTQMVAVAEVYESDVGLVQVGQPTIVTSRNGAFPDQLAGSVTEIGWQIFKNDVLDDDPAANADARVVEVKVKLDNSEPVAALTNLQVDVRIDVQAQPRSLEVSTGDR